MDKTTMTVRLDRLQSVYLSRMARESGRSQGQVIQRLILHAVNSPETLKSLGIWDWQRNKPIEVKT